MATVTFDTLKFVERLEKSGISREHASAIAEAQKDSISEIMDSTLATKGDANNLKLEMQSMKTELKVEMTAIKGEMTSVKYMVGILVAIALANFGRQFFS
jgi:hypothetical protein